MGDGLNRVILLGNLGADPELRYTTGGTAVLNLRLATNETFVDKNKERQERTDWHQVVVWGAQAESLSKMLSKGTCVLVEGGLRTSSYEKDGTKRYKTEVYAREVCLTSGRRGNDAREPVEEREPAARAGNGRGRTAAPVLGEMPF
jgi:single-strand DNA-binding protein